MALNRKELNLFNTIVNCLISIENSNLYIKNRVNIINLSLKRCQVIYPSSYSNIVSLAYLLY